MGKASRRKKQRAQHEKKAPLLKLDLGCGKNRKPGYIGVDIKPFEGVDLVLDIGNKVWPWKDGSVEHLHASHLIEHLTAHERIHFVNELYRVLAAGAKALIIVPNWASNRAYGDLTHQWPPVCEWWFYYLDKAWREANAPHNDFYRCDFAVTWDYTLHPQIAAKHAEAQVFALSFYKEAAQDIVATFMKKAPA